MKVIWITQATFDEFVTDTLTNIRMSRGQFEISKERISNDKARMIANETLATFHEMIHQEVVRLRKRIEEGR